MGGQTPTHCGTAQEKNLLKVPKEKKIALKIGTPEIREEVVGGGGGLTPPTRMGVGDTPPTTYKGVGDGRTALGTNHSPKNWELRKCRKTPNSAKSRFSQKKNSPKRALGSPFFVHFINPFPLLNIWGQN